MHSSPNIYRLLAVLVARPAHRAVRNDHGILELPSPYHDPIYWSSAYRLSAQVWIATRYESFRGLFDALAVGVVSEHPGRAVECLRL
jgi:hypothetical protein